MAEKRWCYIQVNPKLKAKIDEEDLKRVSNHTWRATKSTTGRIRVVTGIRGKKGVRNITLGRFLMKPPKGKQVYPRRFNDGLDYRKSNLVVCTVQERQRLLPKNRVNASSSFRGVTETGKTGIWRARIKVDAETINLGNFDSEAAAAQAYNVAARKHFGDMAYQNQVTKKFRRKRD